MGTAKRERQKANRALKLEQQAKQERVQKVKRTSLRWLLTGGGLVLVILAVLWATGAFKKGDDASATATDSATATATGTGAPASVAPSVTYPPMETPTVKIPEAPVSSLTVIELKPGEGPKAVAGDTLTMYYVGVNSADGVPFDNSYEQHKTFDVTLGTGSVIPGWDQGLIGVQKGGRYQLDIPPDMAYGEAGRPPTIGSNEALTFVIDVLDVKQVGS